MNVWMPLEALRDRDWWAVLWADSGDSSGRNMLGQLLMEVCRELQGGNSSDSRRKSWSRPSSESSAAS